MVLFLRAPARWRCLMHYIPLTSGRSFSDTNDVQMGSSPNHKLMRTTAKTHLIFFFCANVIINYVRDRTCGVCTVPLALAAKPLGNISLQQPLQQIFKLCSEGVWQLHVLQGLKRGQTKGGGWRKDCLRT